MYSQGLRSLPMGTKTLGELHAEVGMRADLSLPDDIQPLKDLRFTEGGMVEIPEKGSFDLTPWSRRQLASILGVRWDRWFETADPRERAEEVNRRFQRSTEERKLRLARHSGDPLLSEGTLRAFLGSTYTPIDDIQVFSALSKDLSADLEDVRFVRRNLTDRSSHFAGITGTPRNIGSADRPDWIYPGFLIRNSEVGFASLTIDIFLFRLVCTNGLMIMVEGKRLLYRQHRPILDEKLAGLLKFAFGNLASSSDLAVERLSDATSQRIDDPREVLKTVIRSSGLVVDVIQHALDAFDLEPIPTRFGIVQALTRAAQRLDPDGRFDMEQLAGRYLEAV